MNTDEKLVITAEEAASLLRESEYIHNYAGGPGMLIGCDFDRDDAVQAFAAAKEIEIAGPFMYGMKHAIAVLDKANRRTFFEADMEKVAALEASK